MQKYLEIPAPNGTGWLNILEGTVAHNETQRWSETRVHSSGGGGYVNPQYGGYVEPPVVSSSVTHHERNIFWVQEANGNQTRFCLNHDNFPVALGHKVRIIWGGSTKDTNNGSYIFAQNFTSGHHYHFEPNDLSNWAFKHGLIQWPLLYQLIFHWSPILIWGYLVFAYLPLLTNHELANNTIKSILTKYDGIDFSFSDFLRLNLELISHWSFSLLISSFTDWEFWIGLIIGFLGCCISGWLLSIFGYFVFGYWWERKILKPFRDRVFLSYDMSL
ncbi:MAG: hypothetical protein KME21_31350 [Desmonostoc vinosum HA7617-LM4]|jgi:hypothetical protein|nr:hypothetical protein [Desmonostoc vinosum HA7617-LM4]